MFGRALFIVVWLIIVAGLALPMYPPEVETAASPSSHSVLHAADTGTFGCQDCATPKEEGSGNCPSDCSCGHLLPAAYVPLEDSLTLSIRVIIGPRFLGPPAEVQPLPPKSPAI